jgi:hypothetical protein
MSRTNPNSEMAKTFEAALRAAHAKSKAEMNLVKRTTHPVAVEGFPGWKVRFYRQANKYNHFESPCFEVTGPTGKTVSAGTGRFKELAQKCVNAGNGHPVDTNFVVVW